jgi:Protein involved in formate dehydrogenase formation
VSTDYGALLEDWRAALGRRADVAGALALWTVVLEGWTRWPAGDMRPLHWSARECRERWERGQPLLAESEPELARTAVEELVGPLMEHLAATTPDTAEALQRFAEAWDGGAVGPHDLLPRAGKESIDRLGLGPTLPGFLALAGLRPALEAYLDQCREIPEGLWTPGGCPWCGGLPAYGDLVEAGRRRLACHLCGGLWMAPRLRCPFCENWESRDLVRLVGEGAEEGYFIEACRACHGFLKGVDRRQRWNAGVPLIEDWVSPHLDLYAAREGYWRATPSLVHLAPAG